MDLTLALRALVRTIERGSITAAARDLNVTQPAVTKHIKNLECHVGAKLLERSARTVRPTALGQDLYEAGRSALGTIDSALENVKRDMGSVEGLLRIAAPSCLGTRHLHPILNAFQDRHPNVEVDLMLDMHGIDVVASNFDLAFCYGRPNAQDLIVRKIGVVRRWLVASPSFLERHGPIGTIEDFSQLALVTTTRTAARGTLTLFGRAGCFDVPVRAMLRTNDPHVLQRTLLEGRCAGPVQRLLVSEDLEAGRLRRILPSFEAQPSEAYVAYPETRFMRPAVRTFIDFALTALRTVDGLDRRDTQNAAAA